MIIANGSIVKVSKTGGSIDPTNGLNRPSDYSYSEPIPCQYRAITYNAIARAKGVEYTAQSYEILIELNNMIDLVQLSDSNGGIIGLFPVISAEYIEVLNLQILRV